MVKCPQTRRPLPTGLKAEWVLLSSLPPVAVPFLCTACGQIHKWKRDEAWIGAAAAPEPNQTWPLADDEPVKRRA